jgi:hypothetical protein
VHERAECALRDHPTLGRWLRQLLSGRLVLDKKKITAEERLDGKYLLSTSDPDLTAEDVALGYKNLLEAERGFRDLKSTLDLRPVFHRVEPRIRAHVLRCWLALLLIRVAERRTGLTWRRIEIELGRLHAVTLSGTAGTRRADHPTHRRPSKHSSHLPGHPTAPRDHPALGLTRTNSPSRPVQARRHTPPHAPITRSRSSDRLLGMITCPRTAEAGLDPTAWTQLLALTGHDARRWEPERLRLRLLSVADRLAVSGRHVTPHLPRRGRWTPLLIDAITRLRAIPPSTRLTSSTTVPTSTRTARDVEAGAHPRRHSGHCHTQRPQSRPQAPAPPDQAVHEDAMKVPG